MTNTERASNKQEYGILNMAYQTILFASISGLCLIIIQLRKKRPFFGKILSQKLTVDFDKTDKKLALIALISFLYCLVTLLKSSAT
jgi:hypothetical protein